MHNLWADLAKMKRDFPIDSLVVIDDDVQQDGEDISGMIAKVGGYLIEEGMLYLFTETGREFAIYPEEASPHFANQVC